MDETRWAAEFLFRYMTARHRCKEGVLSPGSVAQLAEEIRQGRPMFDGVLIAAPHLINDFKAVDFFVAIINGDDGAMPDTDPIELAAWSKVRVGRRAATSTRAGLIGFSGCTRQKSFLQSAL